MKVFKNPETKKCVILSAAVTVLPAAFAFKAGFFSFLLVLVTWLFCTIVFCFCIEYRYRRLEKMSNGINKILHGSDEAVISEFCEGELAVLQSEISKMTKRLRESADILKKDKVFLTDSIADISHQLRTPLTSVNILLSELTDNKLEYSKRIRITYQLKNLISKIEWLIDTLLKMSKIDAGTVKFDKTEISEELLLENSVAPLRAALDIRNQHLVTDLKAVSFDVDLLWSAEAISNIIKNCMEHNPDGANIYVSTRRTGIFTEITVEDEGRGFEKEDIPHIFERFYKGKKDKSEGFGIGLSFARSIIINQNGTVKAENRSTGGAKFTVRFYFGAV